LQKRSLTSKVFEGLQLQPADIHEVVIVVGGDVAAVAIENAAVIGQQILLCGPNIGERLSPKLNADLPLRCDRAGSDGALDRIQRSIRGKLLQAKWRFPLTNLDLGGWELMPVEEDVCARKGRATHIGAIGLCKVAFDFEIELLRIVSGHIDSCAAQAEPVVD